LLNSEFVFDVTGMLTQVTTPKGKAAYSYNGMLKRIQTLQSYVDGAIQKEINYTLDPTMPYNNLLATSGSEPTQNYIRNRSNGRNSCLQLRCYRQCNNQDG